MYAVVDDRTDNAKPEVYVFNDETEATEFMEWLGDVTAGPDNADAWPEELFVVPVAVPPGHWNKNL